MTFTVILIQKDFLAEISVYVGLTWLFYNFFVD